MFLLNLTGEYSLRAMPPSLVRRWKSLGFRSPLNNPCRERESSLESNFSLSDEMRFSVFTSRKYSSSTSGIASEDTSQGKGFGDHVA